MTGLVAPRLISTLSFHKGGLSMECWASLVGDCGQGPSGEHYISEGVFDHKVITAFGLPWCKDRPISIGLGNAVSKILCRTHNSVLSPYDKEAAKLSRFLSTNILQTPRKDDTIMLNGVFLEKWSLKTFVNLGYIGALDPPTFARVAPQEAIVRYLYQNTDVKDGVGLYFVTGTLSNKSYETGVSWNVIRNPDAGNEVVAMTFSFNGIRFIVSGVPERAEQHIQSLGSLNGVDYSNARILYRPRNIVLDSSAAGRKQINLRW